MIPQRTRLAHLALLALPSAYIAAQEMHVGDSYFSFDPLLMLGWLGLFSLAALMLHGAARWSRALSESSKATASSLASWSAGAAQGMSIALAFGGGIDTDGMELGLIFAAVVTVIIGLYYGVAWLIRRFKKAPAAAPQSAPSQVPEAIRALSWLDKLLAAAGTVAVFCVGAFAPDYWDAFYFWKPAVLHSFQANGFIPVMSLINRSLIEIAIPVGIVLVFRKRLLALNIQKIAFVVSIAAMAALGTFGSYLSLDVPMIWISADNAEALIGDELKTELYAMAEQNPGRLCEYAAPKPPELGFAPNFHFTYRSVPFAIYLTEFDPMVREQASRLNCLK